MVVATAAGHRVFLRQTQARQGLAGVQQLDLSLCNEICQELRARCHAGQQLQEVQRTALASQQRTRRAFQMKQRLIGFDPFAVTHLPMHRDTWIELTEHSVDPCRTADNGVIAGDDGGFGQTFGGDQLRGDVAAADVFEQRTAHVGFDFGGQIGET